MVINKISYNNSVCKSFFRLDMLQLGTTIGVIFINFGMLVTLILAWMWGVSKLDMALFAVFYLISGFGITLGYHRYFTHKSFKTYRFIEYILCICGSMAAQGKLAFWVGKHRIHHHFTDKKGDPHSPAVVEKNSFLNKIKSFIHSHMGWLFIDKDFNDYKKRVNDILKNSKLTKIQNFYWLWLLLGLFIPAVLGGAISQSWKGALTGFLWGGLARICVLHHVTWSINSICHVFGSRMFNSKDNSKNNFLVAFLAFGEGFHNNHHAFAYSAKHGWFRFWQVDVTYIVIKVMEKLGLVWDIKLPTIASIKNKLITKAKNLNS